MRRFGLTVEALQGAFPVALGMRFRPPRWGRGMAVGLLSLDLHIPDSNSLKDKRRVLRRLLDQLHDQYNVSAAELGDHNIWRRSQIGIVCLSNDRAHTEQVLQSALGLVDRDPRLEVLQATVEWL